MTNPNDSRTQNNLEKIINCECQIAAMKNQLKMMHWLFGVCVALGIAFVPFTISSFQMSQSKMEQTLDKMSDKIGQGLKDIKLEIAKNSEQIYRMDEKIKNIEKNNK